MSRLILRDAILSYPNLFAPRAAEEGGKAKYSAAFIFPDPAALTEYKKAALAKAQERWGDKLKGAKIRTLETQHGPATFLVAGSLRIRLPWQDNAEVVESKGYPEGSVFINARSESKPGIVGIVPGPNNKPQPVADEALVYPGVIVNVSVDLYAYSTSGNNGIAAGLGNVQVVRDGDRLDSRVNAADEFDADADAAADLSDLTGEDGELAAVGADDGDDLSDLIG
jgi:hypothetical protein